MFIWLKNAIGRGTVSAFIIIAVGFVSGVVVSVGATVVGSVAFADVGRRVTTGASVVVFIVTAGVILTVDA